MTRHALALATTIALFVAPASAQQNPLLGEWLSTFMDPRGITNSVLRASFQNDGQLIVQMGVSGQGGSGVMTVWSRYHFTGPNSYSTTIVGYEPQSMPPFFGAPGQTSQCTFTFESQVAMDVECGNGSSTRFTRQP